jgi:hypothetical protein
MPPSSKSNVRANLAAIAQRRRTAKEQLPSPEDVIASALMAGVCIGLCVEKGVMSLSLSDTNIIRSIKFESTSLFKCYCAAVGTSLLLTALTSRFSLLTCFFLESKTRISAPSSTITALVGGIAAGAGIFMAGGDLSTAFVRAGTGEDTSRFVLYGAGFASIIFSMVGDRLSTTQTVKETLDSTLSMQFYVVAGICGCICLTAAIIVESWAPYLHEFEMVSNLPRLDGYTWPLFERSWGPTLCGVLIGLSQWINILVISQGLDLKDTFTFPIAQITRTGLFDKDQFSALFKKASINTMNMWSLVFGISLYCGGWLSSWSSGIAPRPEGGKVGPAQAAAGGFLLMSAAQLTGLSVLGHMLTGVGHLSHSSILTTLIAWIFAYLLATRF